MNAVVNIMTNVKFNVKEATVSAILLMITKCNQGRIKYKISQRFIFNCLNCSRRVNLVQENSVKHAYV